MIMLHCWPEYTYTQAEITNRDNCQAQVQSDSIQVWFSSLIKNLQAETQNLQSPKNQTNYNRQGKKKPKN